MHTGAPRVKDKGEPDVRMDVILALRNYLRGLGFGAERHNYTIIVYDTMGRRPPHKRETILKVEFDSRTLGDPVTLMIWPLIAIADPTGKPALAVRAIRIDIDNPDCFSLIARATAAMLAAKNAELATSAAKLRELANMHEQISAENKVTLEGLDPALRVPLDAQTFQCLAGLNSPRYSWHSRP